MLYTVWVYEKVNYMYKKVWSNPCNSVIEKPIPPNFDTSTHSYILRFTFTSTHLTNFFSGEEGDLSVGFPDRFNSSVIYMLHIRLKIKLLYLYLYL